MGIDYSVRIAFGIQVCDLLKEETKTIEKTKYNEDTGEPYTETDTFTHYLYNNFGEVESYESYDEFVNYLEYDLGLEVCRDSGYDYENLETSVIGEIIKLSMDETQEYDYEEVNEECIEVLENLKEKVDIGNLLPKMYIMPLVC